MNLKSLLVFSMIELGPLKLKKSYHIIIIVNKFIYVNYMK